VLAPMGVGTLAGENKRRDYAGQNRKWSIHAWSPSSVLPDSMLLV